MLNLQELELQIQILIRIRDMAKLIEHCNISAEGKEEIKQQLETEIRATETEISKIHIADKK